MNILKYIQSHLNIKLFLSFTILILVFTIVLIAAVEFVMPNAFESHLHFMKSLFTGEEEALEEHNINLYDNFRMAIYDSLRFALSISLLSAVIISVFFSNEFVRPIRELSKISQKISEGKYDQRILLPKELAVSEMDELRQLTINFNLMASKLEKTEDLRRQLIGDVSHELRTPISFIKASMEGLIDGIVPNSKKSFYKVQTEAERLMKLINDLQELNIIESDAYKINKEICDINQVISMTISNIAPQYSKKEIRIIKNFQSPKLMAFFDCDRIKQVLTNILANAYQYSGKGGIIKITSKTLGQDVLVSIMDTGRGIKKEDLTNIFTRFFRADKSRSKNSGGTGIGLTIAKQLVEAHGGKIWAESKGENKGAVISFTLPHK